MALSESQKVTVAEITQETYATIDSLVSSLNASQEAAIVVDITTWAANRDDVDLEYQAGSGGGADLRAWRLLAAIRARTRKTLGLPLYSSEVQQGSVAIRTIAAF